MGRRHARRGASVGQETHRPRAPPKTLSLALSDLDAYLQMRIGVAIMFSAGVYPSGEVQQACGLRSSRLQEKVRLVDSRRARPPASICPSTIRPTAAQDGGSSHVGRPRRRRSAIVLQRSTCRLVLRRARHLPQRLQSRDDDGRRRPQAHQLHGRHREFLWLPER